MSQIQLNGAVRLTHWGVIRASGEEAASFLHNQLTQDVKSLDASRANLAAFCSAKGRMLASVIVLRPATDEVLLVCSADLLPAALKRLSMFVMRAKVKLSDASQAWSLFGITGASADALSGAQPGPAWSAQPVHQGYLVQLPQAAASSDAAPQHRCLWVGPAEQASALEQVGPSLPLEQWQWLDVVSGVPSIVQATVEQFVPQMINFELVGGVNFKKGCYPGQEVVARSQYLGKLKRRAALFHADTAMQPAQEVFSQADPGQPSGMVVNAAPNPAGGWSALIEVKLAALEKGDLHLGAPDGPALRAGTLPYALVDEPAPAQADQQASAG